MRRISLHQTRFVATRVVFGPAFTTTATRREATSLPGTEAVATKATRPRVRSGGDRALQEQLKVARRRLVLHAVDDDGTVVILVVLRTMEPSAMRRLRVRVRGRTSHV